MVKPATLSDVLRITVIIGWGHGRSNDKKGITKMIETIILDIQQVGEMKGNEIRLLLMISIMIPIQLCFLPIHSPGICMPGPNE